MPELARFYGLVVFMNYREHEPPHIHARYGDYEVVIEINTGIVKGQMPGRALKLIFEWMDMHKEELMENWVLAKARKPFKAIEPLK